VRTDPVRPCEAERLDRRAFLARLGVLAAGIVGLRLDRAWAILGKAKRARRSKATRMWSGRVRLKRYTVKAGRVQRFDPNRSTTVIVTGNLVVKGVLEMRPAKPGVVHTLRFKSIDESKVEGGGMDVLPNDVGLWVMDKGRLNIRGTRREGWNRTGSDPSWRAGDEIRRAPHEAGDYFHFPVHTPGDPVPRAYPEVPPTEVFNVTRNVVIEGTPQGRAHIFIHSKKRQRVRHALIRYMSPGALGRYPLHFHHCENGSRGSVVEGVVIRDSGNRGFVAHASHGVTFRDCVAFEVENAPFWWDHNDESDFSNDVRYEHCLAGLIGPSSSEQSGQNAFRLVAGHGNAAIDCVAVGNGGQATAGAFHWTAEVNHDPNVWRFEDCVAHNNKISGIFVWQNDNNSHVIDRFTAYHNGEKGIEQGAYANAYHYRDSVLVANGEDNLIHHSNSRFNDALGKPAGYSRIKFYAKGRTGTHIAKATSNLSGSHAIVWDECEFFDDAVVVSVNEGEGGEAAILMFTHCLVNGEDMEPSDVVIKSNPNGTIVRGQRRDGTSWQVDGS
jgi:hypothetical protein